jgi:hypothetical protein
MPPQRLLSQVHRLTAAWRVLAAALLLAALVQPGGTPALAAVECALLAGQTITFASGLAGQTINLTSGPIPIIRVLTIDASGASCSINITNTCRRSYFASAGSERRSPHCVAPPARERYDRNGAVCRPAGSGEVGG